MLPTTAATGRGREERREEEERRGEGERWRGEGDRREEEEERRGDCEERSVEEETVDDSRGEDEEDSRGEDAIMRGMIDGASFRRDFGCTPSMDWGITIIWGGFCILGLW